MVSYVVYGRGSFDQIDEILAPQRKGDAPMIFLVDDYFKNGASTFISMTDSTLAVPSNAFKDVPRPEPLQVRLPSATRMLATFPSFCKHQLEQRFFKIQGCYSEFSDLYAPLFRSWQNSLQGNRKSVFFQELSKARK